MSLRPVVVRSVVMLVAVIAASVSTPGRTLADLLPGTPAVDAHTALAPVERTGPLRARAPFEQRIRALIPDVDEHCLRIDQAPGTRTQLILDAALGQIRKSELGAWLVRVAASQDVTVCMDGATPLEAHYRAHLRLLGLSTRLDAAGRVVFLAHELAHVPQHPRFSNNRRFAPADMLLLQRIREAAAEAVATRVLWQLREQGITAPWRAKLATAYHDIAERFETTMAEGKGMARELWATRAAFHRWFRADWRLEIYDDLMLDTLTRIAGDPIGIIPTSRHLSDRYLRGIADYAGQGFLIGGDGQALIDRFHARGLAADSRARLDAILATPGPGRGPIASTLSGETLSAVSPGPVAAEGE